MFHRHAAASLVQDMRRSAQREANASNKIVSSACRMISPPVQIRLLRKQ